MKREKITKDFIEQICGLYGDNYNDTEEDSSLGGSDWAPGKEANHKSLRRFKEELEEMDIHLSTSKIRKILISGGVYSTELSRSVAKEMEIYKDAKKVAKVLGISTSTVTTYLPYQRQVYNEEPSENARTIKKWREKKRGIRN